LDSKDHRHGTRTHRRLRLDAVNNDPGDVRSAQRYFRSTRQVNGNPTSRRDGRPARSRIEKKGGAEKPPSHHPGESPVAHVCEDPLRKNGLTPFPGGLWHDSAVEFLNFVLIFMAGYLVLRRPERERLAFGLLVASSLLMATLFLIGARGSILPGLNY
jgi:hypothetical protein